jgi:thiol-disulfide isomerase/thioredoxin
MERKNQSQRHCIRLIAHLLFLASFSSCKNDSVDEISLKSLAELPSKNAIVVVNFWATWCPPCLMEIPHLNRLHKERPDVHIYGVSTDDAALGREVFKFVEKYKIRYPVYMKERSSKEESNNKWYENVDSIPVTYIFKNGVLHNTIVGAIEKGDELAQAIDGPSEEEQFAAEQDEEFEEDEGYSGDEEE